MIFISDIKIIVPPELSIHKQKSELLPFYKEMYKKIGGLMPFINLENITVPIAGEKTGKDLILQVLKKVVDNQMHIEGKEPLYYIDVRASEDYSAPAPDYFLLSKVGLKHTKPLNIRGISNTGLIHSLKIMKLQLENSWEEYAIASVSQRFEPHDFRGKKLPLVDGGVAFALKGKKCAEEGFLVKEFQINRNRESFLNSFNKDEFIIGRNNSETRDSGLGLYKRENSENYDFGCMDVLYTLEELTRKKIIKHGQEVTLVAIEKEFYTTIKLIYQAKGM